MTKADYRKWLDSLKPGDEVAVVERGGLRRIARVVSRTKRHIRTEGRIYSARTGVEWCDPWITPEPHRIVPATAMHREQVRRNELRDELTGRLAGAGLSTPTLEAMLELTKWNHRGHIAASVMELIDQLTRPEPMQ